MADTFSNLMRTYGGYARLAGNEAMRAALDNISGQYGNELAGTPGFLASRSIGPGGLARLRRRNMRSAVSNLAGGYKGIAADTARATRDFAGGIISMREQARIQKEMDKQSGGGLLGTIAKIAGTGLGAYINPASILKG